MRFLHTADIHLGKRFNDVSLIEDQRYIMNQILQIAIEENVDAIIIAGDIYQKSMPSEEAMEIFDAFTTKAAAQNIKVFAISGNHDSDVRVSYMASLMKNSGVYISEKFDGRLQQILLKEDGTVCDGENSQADMVISLMPFLKPVDVRPFYPEKEIHTYEDAIKAVLNGSHIDTNKTNILVAHQFISGCSISDSEEFAIGGLDNISAELFADFDYVALGHLHGPQKAGREEVRYSGSPLKYSFSEVNHKKSVTIVDVASKPSPDGQEGETSPAGQGGETSPAGQVGTPVQHRQVQLNPLRDVRVIKDEMSKILAMNPSDDYVHIILTDELVDPDARRNLQISFPNMLRFSVENSKTAMTEEITPVEDVEDIPIQQLFERFYKQMNGGAEPGAEHMEALEKILAEMEGRHETN